MKHLISIDDIGPDDRTALFQVADRFSHLHPTTISKKYMADKILANVFYEPSTRTSTSFHSAMLKLGGQVIPINEINYSSVAKGENIEDTIRTIGCYSDLIVLRTKNSGDAAKAAKVSSVPIINAGDGNGEHPTQTLLDLYTIYKIKMRLQGLNIVFAGDIENSRTIHSLAKAVEKDNEVVYCDTYSDLSPHLPTADVLYMTRVQRERGSEGTYQFTMQHSQVLNKKCIIMHPFPRNEELPQWVDRLPNSVYFKQIQNGLYIRMALLLTYKGEHKNG
jgi:aspartate carbamoyltransferase catalytic subunit